MRPHLFHARTGSPPVRLATALALLATVCSLALLLQSNRADASIAAKQDALASVRDKQASVADQVASANQQINDLIGQVSEARQREAAAAAQLAEAQKELATASNQLADGRAHLRDVREQLRRATDELKKILVGVYKSDDPNLVKLLLDSSRWEDAGIDAAYLNRIHEYQANTVQRVTDLRAEAADTVDQLAAAKQRISEQRDAIAARQQQLADVRAGLEAQESQLAAARAARKQTLSTLASRETSLQSGIDQAQARQARAARRAASKITPPIPEAAPSGPTVAAPAASAPAPAPSGSTATLNSDGSATAPADAPAEVKAVIAAANQIKDAPYVWGGGHGSFDSSGYDCSGAVSFALHGGGFLSAPLDSTGLSYWGESGPGSWITVYANSGHVYAVIAGLRWDTSGTGGSGPSWSTTTSSFEDASAFTARHPAGF